MQVGVTKNLYKNFEHHDSISIPSTIEEHKGGLSNTIKDKVHQDWDYMSLQEFPSKSISSKKEEFLLQIPKNWTNRCKIPLSEKLWPHTQGG